MRVILDQIGKHLACKVVSKEDEDADDAEIDELVAGFLLTALPLIKAGAVFYIAKCLKIRATWISSGELLR
jgi:hypothetical protein